MSFLTPRRIVLWAFLTAAWVGLWGTVSFANIAAGLLVAVAVSATGIGTPGAGGIRPVALMKLFWLVFVDLVQSTVSVAREILTPTDNTKEGVISVQLTPEAVRHRLFLTSAITLTPGTAVIDSDAETGLIHLHLLHIDKTEDTIAHVHLLAETCVAAWPQAGGAS